MKKEELTIIEILQLRGNYVKKFPKQMEQIELAYNQNLKLKEMRLIANFELNWQQMRIIRQAFHTQELQYEQVKVFAKSNINADMMMRLMHLFTSGASIDEVQKLIDENCKL